MSKKRTRSQKMKTAAMREFRVLQPAVPTEKAAAAPLFSQNYITRDFLRTLVSTVIVLGVLLSVFVYTRMSF